jgi:hypothetical protein
VRNLTSAFIPRKSISTGDSMGSTSLRFFGGKLSSPCRVIWEQRL